MVRIAVMRIPLLLIKPHLFGFYYVFIWIEFNMSFLVMEIVTSSFT